MRNTAVALARLGAAVSFAGCIGDEAAADGLLRSLKAAGVDTENVARRHVTTLQVICSVDERGDRALRACPSHGLACDQFRFEDLPPSALDGLAALFTGGVQLIREPMRGAALQIAERCRERGAEVVFDLNLRTGFGWDRARRDAFLQMTRSLSTHLLGSEEEFSFLTGLPPAEAARSFASPGRAVVLRKGDRGAELLLGGERMAMGAFPVRVVDTIGAGDNFNGGYLAALVEGRPPEDLLRWGSAAAAVSLTGAGAGRGASREELDEMLRRFAALAPVTRG